MMKFKNLKVSIVISILVLGIYLNISEASSRKIVFLGDSLTSGYQLPQNQAYPFLIGKKLAGTQWQVVNAGISGDTSTGGLARIDWILKGQPDIVVVALGANDGLRGITPWIIQVNLDKIVSKCQDAGASVAIVGMKMPPNYGIDYRQKFNSVFKNVAQKYVILYIPFLLEGVAGKPELNLSDGIHPNAKGHQVIANTVYQALIPLLEKRERGQL